MGNLMREKVMNVMETITDYSVIRENFKWYDVKKIAEKCDDNSDDEEVEKQINLFLMANGYSYNNYKWSEEETNEIITVTQAKLYKKELMKYYNLKTEQELLWCAENYELKYFRNLNAFLEWYYNAELVVENFEFSLSKNDNGYRQIECSLILDEDNVYITDKDEIFFMYT